MERVPGCIISGTTPFSSITTLLVSSAESTTEITPLENLKDFSPFFILVVKSPSPSEDTVDPKEIT